MRGVSCVIAVVVAVALLAASPAAAINLSMRVFGDGESSSPGTERCGQQNGGKLCAPRTATDKHGRVLPVCCSKLGFCGNDQDYHCSVEQCQSQCERLPKFRPLTKAVRVVPLPGVVDVVVMDTACPLCQKPAPPAPAPVVVIQQVPVAISKIASKPVEAKKVVATATGNYQALKVVMDADEDGRSLLSDDATQTYELRASKVSKNSILNALNNV